MHQCFQSAADGDEDGVVAVHPGGEWIICIRVCFSSVVSVFDGNTLAMKMGIRHKIEKHVAKLRTESYFPPLPGGRMDSVLLHFRRARLLASGQLPPASCLPVSSGNGSAPLLLHQEGENPTNTGRCSRSPLAGRAEASQVFTTH